MLAFHAQNPCMISKVCPSSRVEEEQNVGGVICQKAHFKIRAQDINL